MLVPDRLGPRQASLPNSPVVELNFKPVLLLRTLGLREPLRDWNQ